MRRRRPEVDPHDHPHAYRFGEGDQLVDGGRDRFGIDEQRFGARNENDVMARLVDGLSRGMNAPHREGAIVELGQDIDVAIFDGKSGDARLDREGDVRRHAFGLFGKARLVVGIHGHLYGLAQRAEVLQHFVAADGVVGPAHRPGESRAARGQRGEAQMLK